MKNKIELLNVRKSFGGRTVLNGVNLGIPSGCSTMIIGASGTGKSMILKCMLGLVEPDSGRIVYNEEDKLQPDKLMSKIGVLFQSSALFDSLTIWENVAFELMNGPTRMKRREARDIAVSKLERVGLSTEIATNYPSQMSGGMKKRVALARAIASDPEILFFDEPTSGLDPVSSFIINALIREIVDELNATALSITHSLKAVRQIADRVALMDRGTIRWTGSVNAFDTTDDPFVRQFIEGSPDGPINPQN